MRTLYVPLFADSQPFISHKEAQQRTTFKNCIQDVYWLSGSDLNCEHFETKSRILSLPIAEKFENIYAKTILGFKWLLKNEDFDFLIRTNTSTYFDTSKVDAVIQDWHETATIAAGEFGNTPYTLDTDVNRGYFLAGTAIVLSRDLVEKIVQIEDVEWRSLPDDVALSKGISSLGITFRHLSRIDLTDYKHFQPASHYRMKSWQDNQDTTDRFFELDSLIHSRRPYRLMKITRFHIREFSRYSKAFPLKKGLNSLRWTWQILRYLTVNRSTWKWILGKDA
jgi:hypothetical protein